VRYSLQARSVIQGKKKLFCTIRSDTEGTRKTKICDCLTKTNQPFLDKARSSNLLAHEHGGQEVCRRFGPVCVRCCLQRAFHLAAKWQEWHFLLMLKQTEPNPVSRLSTKLLRNTHACNTATHKKVLGLALQTARGTKYLCNMGWLGPVFIKEIWKPTTERSNAPSREKTLMYECKQRSIALLLNGKGSVIAVRM